MRPDQKSFALAVLASDQCDEGQRSHALLDELAELRGVTRAEAEELVRPQKKKKKKRKKPSAGAGGPASEAEGAEDAWD